MHLPLNPNRLTLACILCCLCLLVAGLWPFNFLVNNHAYLILDGRGLQFDAPVEQSKRDLGGMVFTPNPLVCRPIDGCEEGALTIAVELRAEREARSCLKSIVELHRSDGTNALSLGQWKSFLIVRSFNTPLARGKPYREIGVDRILAPGRTGLLTISSGRHGTDIYFDGQQVQNYPGVRLLKENDTLEGHRVYLGNSPELSCPWAGSVLGFAIFGKTWTPAEEVESHKPGAGGPLACSSSQGIATACYRLVNSNGEWITDLSGSANHLWKPRHLVFKKKLLGFWTSQSFPASDLMVNMLGFVPFGLLVYLRLIMTGRRRAQICLLLAISMGLAVSLAIEVTQVWLPGRDSSLPDVVANTVGSAIGGAIAGLGGWSAKR